jgi:hypothetical protein
MNNMDINQQVRDEVYRVIDNERQRQESKWGIKYNTPGEWVMILEQKILEAKQAWYFNKEGRESCISLINQIAAVAVAALEQHGTEFELINQYGENND